MLEKGKKIGDYVLLEKLGTGGFGEVWKAEKQTRISTSYFALKFFRPKDAEEIELERVKKEIEIWQKLSGLPYIVSVVEADDFEDYIYIVSEYADGGSLEKWLKNQPEKKAESIEQAVQITSEILKGLERMHNLGFVHRDLKPANVLIKKGHFCLADFGISREMKTHSKATATAGTYEYMPPEAFSKLPSVTPRTDVWAVGAIFQQLLTGKLPFPHDEIPSLIAAILHDEPEAVSRDVPVELKEIVEKALRKEREERFQSAREMREALEKAVLAWRESEAVKTLVLETDEKTLAMENEELPPTHYRPGVSVPTMPAAERSIVTEQQTQLRQAASNIPAETQPSPTMPEKKPEMDAKQQPLTTNFEKYLPQSASSKLVAVEGKNLYLAISGVLLAALVVIGVILSFQQIFNSNESNLSNSGSENKTSNTSPANTISETKRGSYPPIPTDLAQAEIKSLDGVTFNLNNKKGKVVLINLWATWCSPCRGEMPHLVEMQETYADKGFEVIGLDIDPEPVEEINEFAKTMKLNYQLGWAERDLVAEFYRISKFNAIPQSFLIDRNSNLRGVFLGGGKKTVEEMKKTVEKVINE